MNEVEYSYKGRQEVKEFLDRAYGYLLKEMSSNKRIPFDQKAYDYVMSLSLELDMYL